jgi:glycosyltransferase involved in cell wall biosynthesis
VTGAYAPEFSAGGLQCQAVARVLAGRAIIKILTTSTTEGLPVHDRVEGVPVTRVRIDRSRAWPALSSLRQMTAALLRLLPDTALVHIQGFSTKNLLIVMMARFWARPVVLHLQTAKHDEPQTIRAQGPHAWWAFRSADRYVAVSRGLADRYLEAGMPPDRIEVIPNGVDTARFRPATGDERRQLRRSLDLPVDRRVILFVGVMSVDKQPHVLLEAWLALAPEQRRQTTLVFVGATDPRLYELQDRLIEQLTEKLSGIEGGDAVRFVAPTSEIEHYYRAADLLVMPSLREGLPNVVLEAMACGLPVVASRLPGSTDTMIADGVNGRLLTPGDTAGFASAIGDILGNPQDAARLGAEARRTIEEHYRIERVAERWLSVYERVLSPPGGAPRR